MKEVEGKAYVIVSVDEDTLASVKGQAGIFFNFPAAAEFYNNLEGKEVFVIKEANINLKY